MTNEIKYSAGGGITFAGHDAVEVFRAATLATALGLLQKGITPTRGFTRTKALAMAKRYTGQAYGRGDAEIDRARADLKVWIETMKSALPTTDERGDA